MLEMPWMFVGLSIPCLAFSGLPTAVVVKLCVLPTVVPRGGGAA